MKQTSILLFFVIAYCNSSSAQFQTMVDSSTLEIVNTLSQYEEWRSTDGTNSYLFINPYEVGLTYPNGFDGSYKWHIKFPDSIYIAFDDGPLKARFELRNDTLHINGIHGRKSIAWLFRAGAIRTRPLIDWYPRDTTQREQIKGVWIGAQADDFAQTATIAVKGDGITFVDEFYQTTRWLRYPIAL